MRRTLLAVFLSILTVVFAQSAAPTVASAQTRAQRDRDAAIAALRKQLSARPDDLKVKDELFDLLMAKHRALQAELDQLTREIAGLTPLAEPAAPDTGQAPVRVGGSIGAPMKIRDVKPAYPPDAQAARIQGVVVLEATIDRDGNVSDAKVLRGQPLLNDAAIAAVRQWQYTPTLLNGVPVPVIMTVTMTFSLQQPASPTDQLRWSSAGCGDPSTVSGPVRVGRSISQPRKLRDVKPFYPIDAQKARVQGVVIMEIALDCTGAVSDVKVLRGQPLLNDAAMEAVRQWLYEPALLNGKPVPLIMTVTVTFTLR